MKDTCTPIFIAALFITVKIWKQPISINGLIVDKQDMVYTEEINSYLLEWLTSNRTQTANAGEDVEIKEPS